MSSKRRLRKNGCTGKVIYKSETDAKGAIAGIKRRGGVFGYFNVYRCPVGSENHPRHWHIGHAQRADRAFVP